MLSMLLASTWTIAENKKRHSVLRKWVYETISECSDESMDVLRLFQKINADQNAIIATMKKSFPLTALTEPTVSCMVLSSSHQAKIYPLSLRCVLVYLCEMIIDAGKIIVQVRQCRRLPTCGNTLPKTFESGSNVGIIRTTRLRCAGHFVFDLVRGRELLITVHLRALPTTSSTFIALVR